MLDNIKKIVKVIEHMHLFDNCKISVEVFKVLKVLEVIKNPPKYK